MEKETGISIVVSTGFYKEPFLPPEALRGSARELADLFVSDIEDGAEGSGRKARLIGEIGTSLDTMTANEEKVFRAAAAAQTKTGVPISTHTTLGTLGFEQICFLTSLGADASRVIIGHLDLANNLDIIFQVLDQGAYVEFDTIGKIKYLPDETRVAFIKACCDRGYEKQLLLSMDITRRSHLKALGGIGYAYLVDTFLPALRNAGVSENALDAMLNKNPGVILQEAV
jgi:phosphotriesterase-related protein